MAGSTDRRVALISVHPEYADKLLSGEKKVELRRSRMSASVTHLVLYATCPRKAVVGWVEVSGIEEASPSRIWESHKQHAGLSRASFRRYFKGASIATAISVRAPHQLVEERLLGDVLPDSVPPQSWRYLPRSSVRTLGLSCQG